ncbi:MAG: hypothetical protein IT434_18095 [Phycisphaerales bacterium]|nr:hypothetical protein [Phycisphaerales bacterium]
MLLPTRARRVAGPLVGLLLSLLAASCAHQATPKGQPLYTKCATNADCASGDCFFYPGRGASYCTHACTQPNDCAPPAVGCNGKGKCRLPPTEGTSAQPSTGGQGQGPQNGQGPQARPPQ